MPEPTVTDSVVDGPHGPVPIRRYEPDLPVTGAVVVWVHGGAFVRGGLDQPETHAVALALAARGLTVITVDYRLASRGPGRRGIRYPIPVDDVVAVVEAVDAPRGVILGGASAGAALACAAVLRLTDTPPRALFLAYGVMHSRLPSPPQNLRVRGRRRFTHTAAAMRLMNVNYAGARVDEPFAFPGGHDVSSFPPTLVMDAEHDVLRSSGARFAEELHDAGVPVNYAMVRGSVHAFLNRPGTPHFVEGVELVVDWITRHLREVG